MTTEQEQIELYEAVPVEQTEALIKFDIAKADIAQMEAEAACLSISGPDDKAGYDRVFQFRQVVKNQRVAVEKKAKEFKAPKLKFNRQVDAYMKELTEPMAAIEDSLAKQEKTYNEERERIRHEQELADRQRLEGRVNHLRDFGFQWNAPRETYEAAFRIDDLNTETLIVNYDDIKNLPDDEFKFTIELIQSLDEKQTAYNAEVKRQADAVIEQKRVEQVAENERLRLKKEELDAQAERQRIAQKTIDDAIEEQRSVDKVNLENELQRQKNIADTERTKRLGADRTNLKRWLPKTATPVKINVVQPEAIEFMAKFNKELERLVNRYVEQIDGI